MAYVANRKWFKVRLALWWIQRVALVIAGILWLSDAAHVAFWGGALSHWQQIFSAMGTGIWLMSSGREKPR